MACPVQSLHYRQLVPILTEGLTMKLSKTGLVQGLTGCLALAAGTAHAGFILVDGDPFSPIYSPDVAWNNDFVDDLSGEGVTTYTLGASLATDSAGLVEFFYYGKEAGYDNQFLANGGAISYTTGSTPTMQNHFGAPIAIPGSMVVGGGLFNFQFCSITGGGCVTNTLNASLFYSSPQSIAMSIQDYGNSAWLFWDDSGAGPDDNHDDMLIKAVFTPTQVPEPQTLGMLGAGLLGVWFTTRRRTRSGLAALS
jgi:hypothetical protein